MPGEVGYASPRDLGLRTLLFDTAAMLSKHTGRARDSMQALWSRLKEGGPQVTEMSWDLEEGGHSASEVMIEVRTQITCLRCCLFSHRSPHMGPHHLPLCLISCGTHQHSLVSRIPLMGPHRPPLCLIWCGVHQHLMKIPLPVCLLNPLVPFVSHRTWLHLGLVGKRQKAEIF